MKILAIETSCDETSVAIIDGQGNLEHPKFEVIAHTLLSQVLEHQKYGGVYPNLARRLHSENLVPILKETLIAAQMYVDAPEAAYTESQIQNVEAMLAREPELYTLFKEFVPKIVKPDIDLIAVTNGPGLEPALWVGLNFAKTLSSFWNVPLLPINHMEGHIMSVLWKSTGVQNESVQFPALALLISGGHTQLVLVKNWMQYELLGETRDDAVGEAFDKVARLLDLPYPGGPHISRLAEEARKNNSKSDLVLPRPMLDSPNYDFSFSGLKTAVRYYVQNQSGLDDVEKTTIAREFEDAVVDVLIAKTKKALEAYNIETLIIGGGVVANKKIRESFKNLQSSYGNFRLLIPEMELATDNAIMIGIAGYLRTVNGESADPETFSEIRASGNLPLSAR